MTCAPSGGAELGFRGRTHRRCTGPDGHPTDSSAPAARPYTGGIVSARRHLHGRTNHSNEAMPDRPRDSTLGKATKKVDD